MSYFRLDQGTVLLGTVKGDIHDLGKNIVGNLLESRGFEVIDLGVDVPVDVFVQKIKEHKPQVVGLSALLTACVQEMKIAMTMGAGEVPGADIIFFYNGGPPGLSPAIYDEFYWPYAKKMNQAWVNRGFKV